MPRTRSNEELRRAKDTVRPYTEKPKKEKIPLTKQERIRKKLRKNSKLTCIHCLEDKFYSPNFYITRSDLYGNGVLMVCKECIKKIYLEIFRDCRHEKTSVYRLCRKLDVSYRHAIFEMAVKESIRYDDGTKDSTDLVKYYFQKLNSIGANNGYGRTFEDSDSLVGEKDIEDHYSVKEKLLEKFEITPELIMFWGTHFNKEQLWFLNEEYGSWESDYTIDSKSLRELIKQLCITQLEINEKRERGDSVDKDLATYQKILGDCNLKQFC
jgi:hypothetical protein